MDLTALAKWARYGSLVESRVVTPEHLASSFTCPHCHALAQQRWAKCSAKQTGGTSEEFDPQLELSTCFACGQTSVWLISKKSLSGYTFTEGRLIHPVTELGGPPRSPNMPQDVADLYDEASKIAQLSPRAACGLLRLALELLLKGLYPDAGNLNAMIGAAAKDGIPKQVIKMMDVTRFSGNENVHELHPDDSAADAVTLFGLLNIAVERLISEPLAVEELYERLPERVKQQVDRRDGQ